MADTSCCQLVGNLTLSINGCVVSISVDSSTEIIDVCKELMTGATVGTVNVSGYADNTIFKGCPSKAGVTIPWMRRYDCENDETHFIKTGEGSSYISAGNGSLGFISSYVTLKNPTGRKYKIINASSSSGPYSLYMEAIREDGYGMKYTKDLFPFDTSGDMKFNNFGVGEGSMYLQSFNIDFNPGAYPTVSYSFMFSISD